MNKVNFFGKEVTKLIVGDNPFNGYSYISEKISGKEMQDFYTAEKIKETLRNIEKTGYNTMLPLADPYIVRILQEYQNEGGNLQYIWQTYMPMDQQVSMREMETLNTIGLYHQGSTVDYLYETGQTDKIRENLKTWHELGVPVGLGTHYPEVIELSEEENWEVDFYLACLHNKRRGHEGEQSGFVSGKTTTTTWFHPDDRKIMLNTLKNVDKPVIAFKIFSGGQIFYGKETKEEIKETVKAVYEEIFTAMKPNDFAAFGVFQRDTDQVKFNYDAYEEWYQEKNSK